jgi:hypothetical protein
LEFPISSMKLIAKLDKIFLHYMPTLLDE